MGNKNAQDFAGASEKTKLVRQITRLVRRACLDDEQFRSVSTAARRQLGLRRPPRSRVLPRILPKASLKKFFEAVDGSGNLQHQIMLRLLFYTAVRVRELVSIRVEDVDLEAQKIFICQGKGSKDRYILFPESFGLTLKACLAGHPNNRYVFESQRCTRYTARRIEQTVAHYHELAGICERVHPHLFSAPDTHLADRTGASRFRDSVDLGARQQKESRGVPASF
ncbi:MAG TPA: tyrosine-type recombinase/integrase, partial [Candidatus Acidoferrales bacterium]|nr:tyrosine-type recombinase/integrase [Candidatus Acidoferrales bacterium]